MIKPTFLALCLCFGDAMACRYEPSYTPEAVERLAKDAALVVEATLTSSTIETSARFVVHRWLKGNGPVDIVVTGFGHGSDCRSPMDQERSILFLSKSADNAYKLRKIGTYSGMHPATRDNIRAVCGGQVISDTTIGFTAAIFRS